jgi:hypothetical protein
MCYDVQLLLGFTNAATQQNSQAAYNQSPYCANFSPLYAANASRQDVEEVLAEVESSVLEKFQPCPSCRSW